MKLVKCTQCLLTWRNLYRSHSLWRKPRNFPAGPAVNPVNHFWYDLKSNRRSVFRPAAGSCSWTQCQLWFYHQIQTKRYPVILKIKQQTESWVRRKSSQDMAEWGLKHAHIATLYISIIWSQWWWYSRHHSVWPSVVQKACCSRMVNWRTRSSLSSLMLTLMSCPTAAHLHSTTFQVWCLVSPRCTWLTFHWYPCPWFIDWLERTDGQVSCSSSCLSSAVCFNPHSCMGDHKKPTQGPYHASAECRMRASIVQRIKYMILVSIYMILHCRDLACVSAIAGTPTMQFKSIQHFPVS